MYNGKEKSLTTFELKATYIFFLLEHQSLTLNPLSYRLQYMYMYIQKTVIKYIVL